MNLKLKSFIQIGTFIFHKKRLTSQVAVNFVDKSLGYPTLKVQYSKILSGRINFISKIHRMYLLVYTGQVSGRLNDKIFSRVGVLYNLNGH